VPCKHYYRNIVLFVETMLHTLTQGIRHKLEEAAKAEQKEPGW
jgi:hypothetical protein